jgi:hypothetical protein
MKAKTEKKLKIDTMKTFRTNEELYSQFVMRSKLRKQKVYERINELILEDLQKPFEVKLSPSEKHSLMFEDTPENIKKAPEEACGEETQQPAESSC